MPEQTPGSGEQFFVLGVPYGFRFGTLGKRREIGDQLSQPQCRIRLAQLREQGKKFLMSLCTLTMEGASRPACCQATMGTSPATPSAQRHRISPNGAAVNSQGREPLDDGQAPQLSPNGATVNSQGATTGPTCV
jgi:hypothetical protein